MSRKPARTPLTDDDKAIIAALSSVRFLPASSDKRFAWDAQLLAEITERQREYLHKLRWKYRRQISATVPMPFVRPAGQPAYRRRWTR